MSEFKMPEINEIKKPEPEGFKDIKPEKGTTVETAKEVWNDKFSQMEEKNINVDKTENIQEFGPKYNDMNHMEKFVPADPSEKGYWEGEKGESKFIPNTDTEAGLKAKQKLSEFGMDGVEYINHEPDFSKCAEATVRIDNMTDIRARNFEQADIRCAEKWNAEQKNGKTDWDKYSVSEWRHDNNCVWHERCDTKTMDLLSRDIHNTDAQIFIHSGGVAECRTRDAKAIGGGFDE